eukprot:CFRG6149T1
MKFTILSITLCLLISLFGVHGKSTPLGPFGDLGVNREYRHYDDARSNSFTVVEQLAGAEAAAAYADRARVIFQAPVEDALNLPASSRQRFR